MARDNAHRRYGAGLNGSGRAETLGGGAHAVPATRRPRCGGGGGGGGGRHDDGACPTTGQHTRRGPRQKEAGRVEGAGST